MPADKTKKKLKRRKVAKACLFCKRSHMTCDDSRPCQRCIKREIGHLCCDEAPASVLSQNQANAKYIHTICPKPPESTDPPAAAASTVSAGESHKAPEVSSSVDSRSILPNITHPPPPKPALSLAQTSDPSLGSASSINFAPNAVDPFGFDLGASLDMSDFLQSVDDGAFSVIGSGFGIMNGPGVEADLSPSLGSPTSPNRGLGSGLSPLLWSAHRRQLSGSTPFSRPPLDHTMSSTAALVQGTDSTGSFFNADTSSSTDATQPTNKTERFLLTAADQKDGSRDERLAKVIHAKYEAGLLKPYNYMAGYTRLMRWMEQHMSMTSRQRVLQTISEFRPTFRTVAAGLTDLDLVFIEEAFERLLLDYDRLFSTMGIPACLWRRTGEIYKSNKEFAELVGVSMDLLKEGKLAIYELMAEESAVSYWEKYSTIAFDSGQKAVLTSCTLINRAVTSSQATRRTKRRNTVGGSVAAGQSVTNGIASHRLQCTFSFTVRRDVFNIPSLIVGNFLPC